jgi:rubredoxin
LASEHKSELGHDWELVPGNGYNAIKTYWHCKVCGTALEYDNNDNFDSLKMERHGQIRWRPPLDRRPKPRCSELLMEKALR